MLPEIADDRLTGVLGGGDGDLTGGELIRTRFFGSGAGLVSFCEVLARADVFFCGEAAG